MELKFTKIRETKNKVVFEEEGDAPAVGTLYLTKEAVEENKLGDKVVLAVSAG